MHVSHGPAIADVERGDTTGQGRGPELSGQHIVNLFKAHSHRYVNIVYSTRSFLMPIKSIRAFASCKGGCGKTTLVFNVACAYALKHPDEHVIIKDFSETGDLSTLCLGGFMGAGKLGGTGLERAQAYSEHQIATIDGMCAAAAAAAASPSGAPFLPLFQRAAAAAAPSAFQMEGRLVDLHALNPAMPVNLFIAVTSPDTASNAGFDTPAKRALVKQGLQQFYESDSRTWTIFIDTDGDRHFTHRTKMGLTLSRSVAVPTDINDNDMKRMDFFVAGVREMAESGEYVPPVDAFILNKVIVHRWEPMNDDPDRIISPCTPSKAIVSEIDRVSTMLAASFCRGGSVEHLPKRFVFPEMAAAGRMASTFGVPVVALKDNLSSLKSSAKAAGLDPGSFTVSDNLVDAIDELSSFLECVSMGDSARTPVKGGQRP